MGLRFRKSFKIAPGVRMTVGKTGVGVSVGGRGLRYSVHSSGRRTSTAGIPGSGLSYSSSSGGRAYKSEAYRRRSELARLERESRKLQEQEYARLQVELIENKLAMLTSIHHECDEPINWLEVASRKLDFDSNNPGPMEKAARARLSSYEPGFFDRLFMRADKKRRELLANVELAKKEDMESYKEWRRMTSIANQINQGNIDAYFEVIEEFGPLDDLVEFGSSFEFGTDTPEAIHVSVDVNAQTVIPEKELSLTKTGKLSEKAMARTKYYDLTQDYVCSCALRIARDMFALLPVKFIFVHAYEDKLDPATGHVNKILVLSVKYDRDTVNSLLFTNVDPSEALANFPHEMMFRKTKGFAEVEPILS
ncbi:DUF4236 domain-containing protein [Neobacillus sp. SCS-31]|uniref:DUF4236 domain-containing protein n=1 Tax=Neobacillus oceani TaxID=3115292 RepID=UPI003906192A